MSDYWQGQVQLFLYNCRNEATQAPERAIVKAMEWTIEQNKIGQSDATRYWAGRTNHNNWGSHNPDVLQGASSASCLNCSWVLHNHAV